MAGKFDLAAAEAVCGDEQLDAGDILDLLAALVDRSMLVAERDDAHVQWRLLETLRQYSAERLEERADTAMQRSRHLTHFVVAAQNADRAFAGRNAADGVSAFERVWDNLRASLSWAESTRDADQAIAMTRAASWYAYFGLRSEHADWVRRSLRLAPDDPELLGMAGVWAGLNGDQDAALDLGRAAVHAAPLEQSPEAVWGWWAVTYAHFYSGRLGDAYAASRAVLTAASSSDPFVVALVASFSCLPEFYYDEAVGLQSVARARRLAEGTGNGVALAFASYHTANTQFLTGNHDAALLEYDRCIELASLAGARLQEMWARTMLAARASEAGWPSAGRRFTESLNYLVENRIWSRVYGALTVLADHLVGEGHLETAATILGFLDARDPDGLFLVAPQRARVSAAVHEHADGHRWLQQGASLDRDAIIDYALSNLHGAGHDL
jgi:hypothetical protein